MAAAQGGQALPVLEVHTDGSISRASNGPEIGPPGPSGCAFVARSDDKSPWVGRFYALGMQVDSREMELMGMYLALQYLVEEARKAGRRYQLIVIHSDCPNAVEEVTAAIKLGATYKASVWRITGLADELWKDFSTNVTFSLVQGHAGVPGNVEADHGATGGAQNSKQGSAGVGWRYGEASETFHIQWP